MTTARAGANIALVKYWGKRDETLNLPAVGSISVTLEDLRATVRCTVVGAKDSRFSNRGDPVAGRAAERMAEYLDWVAAQLGVSERFAIDLDTTFPVGAGLASSAAIYCAAAAAMASWVGADMELARLSELARVGSGSAARSVFGGYVEWHHGQRTDGKDSVATRLEDAEQWPLGVVVAIVNRGLKEIPSRDAMRHVASTSPLYAAWIESQGPDLDLARQAIAARNLEQLGTVAEENCLRMHAVTLAARPPIQYWSPVTLAVMEAVRDLRKRGFHAYFTVDAGPQVKVFCPPEEVDAIAEGLGAIPGVLDTISTSLGSGVEILEGRQPWK